MSGFNINYNGLDFDITNGITVSNLRGLGTPPERVSSRDNTATNGGNVFNKLYGARVISCNLLLEGSTADEYFTRLKALCEALDLPTDADWTMTRWDTANTQRKIAASVIEAPKWSELAGEPTIARSIPVQWYCGDPYFKSTSSTSEQLTLQSPGGIAITSAVSAAFAPGQTSNTVQITNSGNIDSYPDIVFTGPVTNPRLTLVETGESVGVDIEITAGQTLAIFNTSRGPVFRLNGTVGNASSGTNYYQYSVGKLFKLPKNATSTLKFTAQTVTAGTCDITHTDNYLNI